MLGTNLNSVYVQKSTGLKKLKGLMKWNYITVGYNPLSRY
jgi:hypothetical protein